MIFNHSSFWLLFCQIHSGSCESLQVVKTLTHFLNQRLRLRHSQRFKSRKIRRGFIEFFPLQSCFCTQRLRGPGGIVLLNFAICSGFRGFCLGRIGSCSFFIHAERIGSKSNPAQPYGRFLFATGRQFQLGRQGDCRIIQRSDLRREQLGANLVNHRQLHVSTPVCRHAEDELVLHRDATLCRNGGRNERQKLTNQETLSSLEGRFSITLGRRVFTNAPCGR